MAMQELVKFRQKYPQYDSLSDDDVVDKLSTKYPKQYGHLKEVSQPAKETGIKPGLNKDYLMPTFMSGATPKSGDRTLWGDIFERPAATSREAQRGFEEAHPIASKVAYATIPALRPLAGLAGTSGLLGKEAKQRATKAAITPENVETFQEQRIREAQQPVANRTNVNTPLKKFAATNEAFTRGLAPSAIGMVEDIISSPADILSSIGMEAIGGKLAGTKLGKAVEGVMTKQRGAKSLSDAIDAPLSKAIRPTVRGKKTPAALRASKEKGREAVKTIIENKPNLQLFDEKTGEVVNKLPESLDDMTRAVEQTKNTLFKQWDDAAQQTGELIPLDDTIKVLDDIITDKTIAISNPSAITEAKALKQRLSDAPGLTAQEANSLISQFNEILTPFYRNPTSSDAKTASVYAKTMKQLRQSVDDTISKSTNINIAPLKKKYGALKAIEEDVTKRLIVDNRKNLKGFFDLGDIFAGSDIVRGIVSMNPADVASGVVKKGVVEAIKKVNNPNRQIRKMFVNAEKALQISKKPKAIIPPYLAPFISQTAKEVTGQK